MYKSENIGRLMNLIKNGNASQSDVDFFDYMSDNSKTNEGKEHYKRVAVLLQRGVNTPNTPNVPRHHE